MSKGGTDEMEETLDSIAQLIRLQSSSAFTIQQLDVLVKHRSRSLSQLHATMHMLVASREELERRAADFHLAVEEEIGAIKGDDMAKRRCDQRRLDFLASYHETVDEFERQWDRASALYDASTKQSTNWIASLTRSSPSSSATSTVIGFVRLIVADPFVLGCGITTLESSELLALLPTLPKASGLSSGAAPRRQEVSPFRILVSLIASSRGPQGVLDLASGIWETSIAEIVGRESSRKRDYDEKGKGHADSGSRERELQNFLVGVLDVVDSLGLEIQSDAEPGGGPFSLVGAESIFIDLLQASRENESRTSSPVQVSSPKEDYSSWSVTDTLKTLGSYSSAGIYSVATISGTGLSSVASVANLFYSPALPSSTTRPEVSLPLPPPLTKSTFLPSLPSRLVTEPHSFQSPLDSAITTAATSLLSHLTRTSSSYASTSERASNPVPIIEVLLRQLLGKTFPLEKDEGHSHRKILLLGVVRFYAFSWLGRKTSKAGYGGAWSTQAVPSEVILNAAPPASSTSSTSSPLLDEVFVSAAESIEQLSGLHRVIYDAIVEACGFVGSKLNEEMEQTRMLRRAAKQFVRSWSSTSQRMHGSVQSHIPGGGKTGYDDDDYDSGTIRPFQLSAADFLRLHDHFAPLVTHLPATGPISSPSSPISFKRRERAESGPEFPARTTSTFSLSTSAEELDRVLDELRERARSHPPVSSMDESLLIFARSARGTALSLSTQLPNATRRKPLTRTVSSSPLSTPTRSAPIELERTSPTLASSRRHRQQQQPWLSPPRSPRHEALFPSYFRLSPTNDDVESHRGGTEGVIDNEGSSKEDIDMEKLRRGVFSLVKSGGYSSSSPSSDLAATFDIAARRASHIRLYPLQILYAQCARVMATHSSKEVLRSIAAPLRLVQSNAMMHLEELQSYLLILQSQMCLAVAAARTALQDVDSIRLRAYYSSVRSSEEGSGLRSRIREILSSRRSKALRQERRAEVDRWSKAEGVYDFLLSDAGDVDDGGNSAYEEILMECRKMVTSLMKAESFFASPFWKREGEIYENSQNHQDHGRPAEKTTGGWSDPLFPVSMIMSPALAESLRGTRADRSMTLILHPFGAFSSALSLPTLPQQHTDVPQSSSVSIAAYIVRTTLRITSYVWSDISSFLPTFTVGTDQIYLLLHPIPPSPAEPYLANLLKNFVNHPSISKKLDSLVEIELCLAAAWDGAQDQQERVRRDHSRSNKSLTDPFLLHPPAIASVSTSSSSSSYPNLPTHISTDALIPLLESLLLTSFPPRFFSLLQSISSLVSASSVLNSDYSGKAFFDFAMAGLSIKRDWIIEIVERACRLLGEGTEEGKDEAKKLFSACAREGNELAVNMLHSLT